MIALYLLSHVTNRLFVAINSRFVSLRYPYTGIIIHYSERLKLHRVNLLGRVRRCSKLSLSGRNQTPSLQWNFNHIQLTNHVILHKVVSLLPRLIVAHKKFPFNGTSIYKQNTFTNNEITFGNDLTQWAAVVEETATNVKYRKEDSNQDNLLIKLSLIQVNQKQIINHGCPC